MGEWNQGRIVVHGQHIEHWLNGGKTAECDLDSATYLRFLRVHLGSSGHKTLSRSALSTMKTRRRPIEVQEDDFWQTNHPGTG